MSDLLGSLDISESRVNKVRFSILFDFQDRSHKTLNHGLVVNETSVETGTRTLLSSRLETILNVMALGIVIDRIIIRSTYHLFKFIITITSNIIN